MKTIQRWFSYFKSNIKSFEDQHRLGRPITEITNSNTNLFKKFIEDNLLVIYDLRLSRVIHKIILSVIEIE